MRIVFPVCSCGTTWLRPICVFFFFFFFLRFWQPRNGDAARIKSYYKHGSFLCECSQSSLMIPLLLSIWFLTHQSPCNTSSKPFHLFKPQPPPLLSQSQWINSSPTLPEGLPGWLKESACNEGDPGSIPGWGRSPGKGSGTHCSNSCLENSTDRGTWWAKSMGSQRVGDYWVANSIWSPLHGQETLWVQCPVGFVFFSHFHS